MLTADLLSGLKAITQRNMDLLKKQFPYLNDTQKSWRANENSWSINEIFAHLNEFARFFNEQFKNRIENTRFREPKEIFISSPLGRSAWNSMKLGNKQNIKRKFRVRKGFDPIQDNLVTGNDIDTFREHQETMLGILDAAKTVNIRKAKVHIPISKLVRLRLGDALMFAVYHNERHMQQALNVLKNPNFPKK